MGVRVGVGVEVAGGGVAVGVGVGVAVGGFGVGVGVGVGETGAAVVRRMKTLYSGAVEAGAEAPMGAATWRSPVGIVIAPPP